MRRLVALDLPASDTYFEAIKRCFDAGDAICPVDQRLPGPARARLFQALRPGAVIDASGEETTLEGGELVEDGDGVVIATSGSTGEPKGVVLSIDALQVSARATSARLGVDAATDRWVACLPPGHIGGLSVMLRALFTDTALEIHDGFDAERVIEAATARDATLVSLVPTTMFRLGANVKLYRRILLGGSSMPPELPDNAVTTYGMTETGSGVVYDGLALDGVDVVINDQSEIGLRGAMLLRSYRDGFDPKDRDGFLWTGDAGSLDGGRLSVQGRIKDLIISGGENVWPDAVEAVLAQHLNVAEVGVFGLPDPEWGQRVCAAVVLKPGASAPSLDELRDLVRDELGAFAAPKQLSVLETFPRSAIGKLRRHELASIVARTS